MSEPLDLWVSEKSTEHLQMSFRTKRVLFSEKSPFQQVDVIETERWGKMLLNDGMVMVSEADEFIYHEMIAHPALFLLPNAKKVLIIGGGDGGTAREVLRHPEIETVHMVEIDEVVVNACREHLPVTAQCLVENNPRLSLVIEDGIQFAKAQKQKIEQKEATAYDLILVDSSDPVGPAAPLFNAEFYQDLKSILRPGGIIISQAESSYVYPEAQESLLKILNSEFESVYLYNFVNMTYPSGLWSFSLATNDTDLNPATIDAEAIKTSNWNFRYYTPAVHRAAFALSQYQIDRVGRYVHRSQIGA